MLNKAQIITICAPDTAKFVIPILRKNNNIKRNNASQNSEIVLYR